MAQSVVINGTTYSNVPQVQIPKSGGGTAVFYDTSDGDAETGHILTGKKAYGSSGAVSGSMANNGSTSGTISTKAGTVSVPAGYTSGGTVSISTTEQNKIISSNIKSGVTILGVSGATNVVDTTIASGGARQRNILNGYKAYVNGSLVEGNATTPTVTQNTTTKVLTIS